MDPVVLPSALIGALTLFSPLITAVFTRPSMSPKVKSVLAIVIAFLIAAGWVVMNGGVTKWQDIFVAAPVVYGLEQAVYNHLFGKWANTVEAKVGVTDKGEHLAAEAAPKAEDSGATAAAPVEPVLEETPAKG